ncbi:BRCA2-interacting transcriptional repressor EMSY [Sitodiplosis mosellana]|uniref:BRCA2-interacting transcriptional repressor EMSY n=1 Tax=Sitodiplosis mosellana TaxID=263140 RepID=UPI002443A9C5|nr:BRCA2-interacting transcriptional repressor EMSY [Sitodiplosis mosellana]
MWPKLLDLTQDECRGALRRLELESYSNVVGAFRAQGTLNAVKLKILKDLREAFHISDARHKAEVRRVVNDESLSTIAKMIYGPNSEIEWNKEGSRGFLIINRKPSQTALASVADKAYELGKTLNKNLKHPSDTSRDRLLQVNKNANATDKIVDTDPSSNHPKAKSKPEKASVAAVPVKADANRVELSSSATKKQRESNKHCAPTEQPALKIPPTNAVESKAIQTPKVENVQMPMPMPKPITANSRRRKSTTSLANHNAPAPKAMLLTSRRDTMIETSRERIRETPHSIEQLQPPLAPKPQPIVQQQQTPPPPPPKPIVNEVRVIQKEVAAAPREEIVKSAPIYTQNAVHRTLSNDGEVQVIEAIVPQKVETIKGTRNVMNAISQGAQLVKVIDSKIMKKPVTISNMYAKPTQTQPLKVAQPTTIASIKQTFAPVKLANVEYLTVNDCARPLSKPTIGKVAHKIQVITSDAPQMINSVNVVQRTTNHGNKNNDFISIPTARNPNIVKTSDKTIMHVSPHLPQHQFHHHHQQQYQQPRPQINKKPTTIIGQTIQNHLKYPQQTKHVVQIVQQPPQSQPRTLTIHPNSTILKALPTQVQVSTINEMPAEYVYEEQVNDWQNYDPTMTNQNGYVKIVRSAPPNNGRDYQKHANITPNIITENIIYDEDIITEEYITTDEFTADNVIEMDGFS